MIDINTIFETNINLSIFEPYKIKCEQCTGLCCIALYFSKTDGFPEEKKAGIACKNLQEDYKCNIHSKLSIQGLKGCMAYDCYGAGQQISSHLTDKPDWSSKPLKEADSIFNVFLAVMQINQILWYLTQATILCLPKPEKIQLDLLLKEGEQLVKQSLEILQHAAITSFREKANQFLKQICLALETRLSSPSKIARTQNYMGKKMKNQNLTGRNFNMALLIAADLEQAQLYGANFLGADLRDTNIKNTDLSHCLFLTQMQINTAKGNRNTVLPPYLSKPIAWEQ